MQQIGPGSLWCWIAAGTVAVTLCAPVRAQVALFDEPALTAACHQQNCVAEVGSAIAGLRARKLPEPEFNSQIGFLAAILLQSAADAGAAALPQIGTALGVLAQSSTDARQSAAIGQVASAVVNGNAAAVAASAPYAASPSGPPGRFNRPPPPFQSGPGPGQNRSRWSDFWQR